ncbi:hypothetical protein P9112_012826 [Eukaryota sp. TZLM1-RC]
MTSPVLQKKPHIEESSHDVSPLHLFQSCTLNNMLKVILDPGEDRRMHGDRKSIILNIVKESPLSHDAHSLMSQCKSIQRDSANENLFHFLQDGHCLVTLDIRQTRPLSPTPEAQSLPPYGTDPLLNMIYQCSDGDPRSKLSNVIEQLSFSGTPYRQLYWSWENALNVGMCKTFHHPNTGISYFSFPRLEKNRNNSENVCYTWPPTVKLSEIFQDSIPSDESYSLEQRIAVVVIYLECLIVEILQESPLDTISLNTADVWMKYSKSINSSTSSRFLSFMKSCKQPFENEDHVQFVESLIQDLPMDKYVVCLDEVGTLLFSSSFTSHIQLGPQWNLYRCLRYAIRNLATLKLVMALVSGTHMSLKGFVSDTINVSSFRPPKPPLYLLVPIF